MEGQNGDRRLQVMLDQEDRFLPTPNYLKRIQSASVLHQQRRMEILTAVYDALFQEGQVQRNDVFQLAVNLLDRYLSYETVTLEDELRATAAACVMVSLKIRSAREECLSYKQLTRHFRCVREDTVRLKEKEVASMLKWNLNAVTPADFTEELARRLSGIVSPELLQTLIDHCHSLINCCLLSYQFVSVPPSLLASASLCDSISHLAADQLETCRVRLAQLTRVEQDVLVQQQFNVSAVFQYQVQSFEDSAANSHNSNTPTNIEDIVEQEFGHRFLFPAPSAPFSSSTASVCLATAVEAQ